MEFLIFLINWHTLCSTLLNWCQLNTEDKWQSQTYREMGTESHGFQHETAGLPLSVIICWGSSVFFVAWNQIFWRYFNIPIFWIIIEIFNLDLWGGMNKYSSNYSQLSQLILKLPDADQASLLEIAQKILQGETLKNFSEKPKRALTAFISGIFAGWGLSIFLIIFFIKINWPDHCSPRSINRIK